MGRSERVDIVKPWVRAADLIKNGASVGTVLRELGIKHSSLDRYIRHAKRDGLLPDSLTIRDDWFSAGDKLFGREAEANLITTDLIFGDLHVPFHDIRAIKVMCQIIGDLRPDRIIENGDGLDCYLFSKFSKDPARAETFQREREIHGGITKIIRETSPESAYLYLGGDEDNHLQRYVKNIVWANNLSDVPELQIPGILYLEDDEYTEGPIFLRDTFRISHGIRYGENSTKLSMIDYMISGLQNHSHRMGCYYRTTATHSYVYAQNGHMSDVDKAWKKHPNWQQGFSILYMRADGGFQIEQIPIVNHKAIFRGKLYKA